MRFFPLDVGHHLCHRLVIRYYGKTKKNVEKTFFLSSRARAMSWTSSKISSSIHTRRDRVGGKESEAGETLRERKILHILYNRLESGIFFYDSYVKMEKSKITFRRYLSEWVRERRVEQCAQKYITHRRAMVICEISRFMLIQFNLVCALACVWCGEVKKFTIFFCDCGFTPHHHIEKFSHPCRNNTTVCASGKNAVKMQFYSWHWNVFDDRWW